MHFTAYTKLAENGWIFLAQKGKILDVSEGFKGQLNFAQVPKWLADPANGLGLMLTAWDLYVLDCDGKTESGQWVWEWLEATGLLDPLAPCVTSPSGGRKYLVRIISDSRVHKRKFQVPGLSGDKHTELSLLTDRATWAGQHPSGGEFVQLTPLPALPAEVPEFDLGALEALAPALITYRTKGTLQDDWVIHSSLGSRTVAEWAATLPAGSWHSCRVPAEIRADQRNSGGFTVSKEGFVILTDYGDGKTYFQGGETTLAPAKPATWAKAIALPSVTTTRPRIGRGSYGKPVKVLSEGVEEYYSQGAERRGILYEMVDKLIDKRIVYLRANLGAGKTQAIAEYCRSFWAGKKILAVTHRQSLARDLAKVLEFDCYLDHGKLTRLRPDAQPTRLVCSVDSLPKLMTWQPEGEGNETIDLQPTLVAWDLVILDESQAVCAQAHAATLRGSGRSGAAYAALQNLCFLAKQVVAADAFLAEYTVSEVRRFCAPIESGAELLIEQRFLAGDDEDRARRVAMLPSKAALFGAVIDLTSKGRKLWIACSSLQDAKILDYLLQTATGSQGIVITGEHEDKHDLEFLTDANACISARLPPWVIATPAVESGVSVTIDYFDAIAVCGDRGSVGLDSLLQMSMRVRSVGCEGAMIAWMAGGESRVPSRDELIRDKAALRRMTDDLAGKFGRAGELVQWFPADADHYESRLNCEIEQASQRSDLAGGWRAYWTGQGCGVVDLPGGSPEAIKALRGAMSTARAVIRSRRAEGIAGADDLSPDEIADLERAYALTPAQRKALVKRHIADFLEIDPSEVTATVADLDNRAKYRAKLRALADLRAVMGGELELLVSADSRSKGRGVSADASNRAVRAQARLAVLLASGLVQKADLNRLKGGTCYMVSPVIPNGSDLLSNISDEFQGNVTGGGFSLIKTRPPVTLQPTGITLEFGQNGLGISSLGGVWASGETQALARLIAGGGKTLTAALGVDLAAYCRKDQLWRGLAAVVESCGMKLEGKQIGAGADRGKRQYRLDGETTIRAWNDSEPALARLRDSAEGVDAMRERSAQRKADRQLEVIAQLIQDVLDEAK